MRNETVLGANGARTNVAWQAWEIELLRGAIVEEGLGTPNAIVDCAAMLCRPVNTVRGYAAYLSEQDRKKVAVEAVIAHTAALKAKTPAVKVDAPFIRPLTPAELMCGKARAKRTPIREFAL